MPKACLVLNSNTVIYLSKFRPAQEIKKVTIIGKVI